MKPPLRSWLTASISRIVPVGKSERTAPGKECCPFVLLHASGQLGPRSILPIFVVVRRLLNSAEIKDFIKLNEHLMNVLCMEPTVFHGFDNIATASVVAPFLIHSQDLLSYKAGGADAICLACRKTTVFFVSVPAGLCGKSERISCQLIPCGPLQIVAVEMACPHLRHE